MEIQNTVNALLGILILGSGLFAIFEGSFVGKKRFKYSSKNKANRKLIQENKNLKTVLDRAHKEMKLGHWEIDVSSQRMTWSNEMYSIFELDKTDFDVEFDGKHLLERAKDQIIFEDKSIFTEQIEKSLSGLTTSRIEYRINTKSGLKKYIVGTVETVLDDKNNPIKIVGTAKDITTQKEISKSLFQEKKKYHLLTDNLPVAIFRSNVKGELLFVNQAMVEMFGFESESEFLHQNCFSLYDNPDDRAKLLEELNSQGKLTDYKMGFQKKNGETFVGEQNSLIEGNELHGIIQNISDRVKSEEEKIELIQKLKTQNNDLEEFAFIISHNLRSPLSNVMGLTKIFDKTAVSSDNLEILNLIEQSTVNLDLIIQDLNQTLTVREGNKKSREVIDLFELTEDIIKEYSPIIAHNEVKLTLNINKGDTIHSVPSFIKNIIKHLLDNAIKFRKLEGDCHVKLSFRQQESDYQLSVEDNGIGIDLEADENRLFMIYEKLDGNIEGRGLGLYLVKNHINALKGSIKVESQPNAGAKFTVELPKSFV
jgi:PAS domain S-box-containing protein